MPEQTRPISGDELRELAEHGLTITPRAAIKELAAEVLQLRQLVQDFTDPDDCELDHHGGCQAHGYLSLEPGELCPHAESRQLIDEWEASDRA